MFMDPNYDATTISLLNVFMWHGEKQFKEFGD